MDANSSKNPPSDQAGEALAKRLKQCVFEGDVAAFREAFDGYLAAHGHQDPHGRRALSKVDLLSYPLAFRSLETNLDVVARQSRKRWKMWLEVLPLDLQLSLLNAQVSRRTVSWVPMDLFKWEQREAVVGADDPKVAFQGSALADTRDGRAPDWKMALENIAVECRHFAGHLIAWKAWERLDHWMEQAGIHPWEGMRIFLTHFSTPNSEGATWVESDIPLPFWASGLYASASEDCFWDVMARHGGPRLPVQKQAPASTRSVLERMHKTAGDGRAVDFLDPSNLRTPGPRLTDKSFDQANVTGAAWRERVLAHALATSHGPPKARGPGRGRL